jgi:hypothetical protein
MKVPPNTQVSTVHEIVLSSSLTYALSHYAAVSVAQGCLFGQCTVYHPDSAAHRRKMNSKAQMAPAVGFEPTTNRLTADRSTTELRWIKSFGRTAGIHFAHRIASGKFVSKSSILIWLRGRDLNPRSRRRGIMSRTATGQSSCKIRPLLFVF